MTAILSPPRDFAALKALITERAPALSKRLTQIAAFALERPDEVAFGTVSSIAEQAQVQPSALVLSAWTTARTSRRRKPSLPTERTCQP